MSVGLIEHFPPLATRHAIENHFRFCKADGLVILSVSDSDSPLSHSPMVGGVCCGHGGSRTNVH